MHVDTKEMPCAYWAIPELGHPHYFEQGSTPYKWHMLGDWMAQRPRCLWGLTPGPQ